MFQVTVDKIVSYWRCPKLYWYKYKKKIPPKLGTEKLMADAIKDTILCDMAHRAKGKEPLDVDTMAERATNYFTTNSVSLTRKPKKGFNLDRFLSRLSYLFYDYSKRLAPQVHPVKKRPELLVKKLGDVCSLAHRVDVIEKAQVGHIVVSSHVFSKNTLNHSPYNIIAAILTGICNWWVFQFTLYREGCVRSNFGVVDDKGMGWFENCVAAAVDGMRNGPFIPCNPNAWVCSVRICPYYAQCRGQFNRVYWRGVSDEWKFAKIDKITEKDREEVSDGEKE